MISKSESLMESKIYYETNTGVSVRTTGSVETTKSDWNLTFNSAGSDIVYASGTTAQK